MKRIVKVLIVLLMCIPFVVKADMGMPERQEYEVIVTNPEGAKNYADSKASVIPYNTKIKITMEDFEDGELYLYSWFDEDNYKIKKSDVALYGDKVVEPENSQSVKKYKYIAYEDGAYMYKGPSYIYDKVSEEPIPKGTILEGNGTDDCFTYVEYNGQKGWVFTYQHIHIAIYDEPTKFASVLSKEHELVMIHDKVKIFNSPKDALKDQNYEEKDFKIGDTIKVKYYLMYSAKVYIYGFDDGNSVKWIKTVEDKPDSWNTYVYEKLDKFFYPINNVDYYSDLDCKNKVGTLNAMEKIEAYALEDYGDDEVGYGLQGYKVMIKKDNNYYFINFDNKGFESADCVYILILDDNEVQYYEDMKFTKKVDYFKKGELVKIDALYDIENDTIYMVIKDGKKYYIKHNYNIFDKFKSIVIHNWYITRESLNKNITMYKDYSDLNNLKDEVEIPAGESFDLIVYKTINKTTYYFIKYKDEFGIATNLNYKDVTAFEEIYVCPFTGKSTKLDSQDENLNTKEANKDEKENKVMDSKTIIIICVVVGVALAVTAIVVIVLVNKKKKANNVVESVPVEQPVQQVVEQPVAPTVEEPTNDNNGDNN